MSELISRKAVYNMLNGLGGCDARDEWSKGWDKAIDTAISELDDIPAAYDVDKIVKEIKGMSGIQFDGRNESYELNWCISTDRAMEIVKGGGQA